MKSPQSGWLVSSLIWLLLAHNGLGAVTTWDPQGMGTAQPGNGTWENASWSTSETGQATPVGWVEGTAALFATGSSTNTPAFTVTMNSSHTVAGVFNGALTPGPCPVTINGVGSILLPPSTLQGFDSGTNASTTINVPIAGAATLVVEGHGLLYLNAANSYSGGTILGFHNAPFTGSIYFNNNASFGTGPISMTNNGTGGSLVAEGSGAYTIANAVTLTNITLNIMGTPAGVTFSGPWQTGSTAACTLGIGGAANNVVIISGAIGGTEGFVKSGVGTLVLTGSNTYGSAGVTQISGGSLVLGNANGSATGVSGIVVVSGSTLTGNGSTTGAVENSGNISATNLAGGTATLTTLDQTWESGSVYQWAINNASGSNGATSGWDQLLVNGALTINAESSSPMSLSIISLTAANQQGALAAFNNAQDYSWLVLHSTNPPISGFDPKAITLTSASFANAPGSGKFSVSTNNTPSGGDLFVNFVHTPVLTLSNVTVSAGSNAVFSAVNTVSNSSPFTAVYSWKSNNTVLSDGGRISGSATPFLTIANAQPTDGSTYTVLASNVAGLSFVPATLTVIAANTSVTWSNPAPIIYGTALSSNQLNATANVPGTFAYNPGNGTVLNSGVYTLSVVFTPTDTMDYASATNTVSLTVSNAPLTVMANSFTRPYGTANPVFTGTIIGLVNGDNITATYNCGATVNSSLGTYPIVPALVDANNRQTNYSVSLVNGTLAVGSLITWATPASITYGTALSSNQLDATANVPGNFVYNPASGALFSSGTYPLSVVFTPSDSADYNTATDSVNLVVAPAPLTVTAANVTRQAGTTNPVFTGTISGLVNGDNITATYSSSANSASGAGTYPIVPVLVDPNNEQTNYAVSLVNGTLTVTPPPPPITANPPNLIPLPVLLSNRAGIFALCPPQPSAATPAHALLKILTDGASQQTGQYLAAALFKSTGYQFQVATNTATNAAKGTILITTSNALATLGAEGYELTVAPDSVVIRAPAQGGAFYGVQSLLQLLPPQIYSRTIVTNVAWVAPCVYIQDYPQYSWRGVMLDVARHFFNKDEVNQLLDVMAMHKLNTLHLHLSDDQGWRLQILGYPELTPTPTSGVAAGAWRNGIDYGLSPRASTAFDPASGQYGGYYTQNDAREIVAYAAERHITVVPEIEIPLHTSAVLAADPQFSCGHSASTYPLDYPSPGINYNADVFSPGTTATMTFFTNALTQIMNIFPGQYIHCGGDELISLSGSPLKFTSPENDNDWNTYPADTSNMIANGITPGTYVNNNLLPEFTTCAQLSGNSPVYPGANSCCGDISIVQYQHWLSTTLANFIHGNGRTMMGWTEYEFGGLVPNAGIMDWEPVGAGVYAAQAAEAGLPAVVGPGSYCYFNYVEGSSSSLPVEPPFVVGGTPSYLPLSTVYSFNPMPCGVSGAAASNILGAQCILFTEYVPSFRNVMFKLFPRSTAMAEVLWTPTASHNYTSFTNRLVTHEQRFAQMGVNYDHESIPQIGTWGPTVPTTGVTNFYDITAEVAAAGEIDVNFWYTGGGTPLSISSVALLVNGVQVDIDSHTGTAEASSLYQATAPFIPVYTVYVLHLPETVPGAVYKIQAVMAGSGGSTTSGTVYLANWN
jgi:hexosaminidase